MDFTSLHIEKSYINQGDYNLVNNLVCPALKCAVLYRRSVGFFVRCSLFNIDINTRLCEK